MLKTSRCPKRAERSFREKSGRKERSALFAKRAAEKSGALFSRKERPKRAERSFHEKSGRNERFLKIWIPIDNSSNKIQHSLRKYRARTIARLLVGVAGKKQIGTVGFDQKPLIRALTWNCRMFLWLVWHRRRHNVVCDCLETIDTEWSPHRCLYQ